MDGRGKIETRACQDRAGEKFFSLAPPETRKICTSGCRRLPFVCGKARKARPVALPNTRRGIVSFPAAGRKPGYRRQTIAVLEMRMRFFDALCYTGTWFHVRRAEVYKKFLFIALWPLKKFSSLVWFVDPLFTSGLRPLKKKSLKSCPSSLLAL